MSTHSWYRRLAVVLVLAAVTSCSKGVEPSDDTIVSVQITPPLDSLKALGASVRLTAQGRTAAGTSVATGTVAWTTSNGSVASVDAQGDVTAIANGSAQITATVGTLSASATIIVLQMPASVAVTVAKGSLDALGDTTRVSSVVEDSRGNIMAGAPVTWTSSDNGIATVAASGLVTAAGNGNATITAHSGTATGTTSVSVMQVAASISVTAAAGNLTAFGATRQFSAAVADARDNPIVGATVTWSSLDGLIATVNSGTGLVTAVGNGSTTIRATSGSAIGDRGLTVAQTVSSIAFGVQPAAGFADSAWTPAPTVTLRDANGNVALNSSASVTVAIEANPRGGLLSGTATRNAVSGVATFTGLRVSKAGVNYTVRATSAALSAVSQAFTIALNPRTLNIDLSTVTFGASDHHVEVNVGNTILVGLAGTIWNQSDCPGCVSQVIAGFGTSSSACHYTNVPGTYPGAAFNAGGQVPTPVIAGTYLLRVKATQALDCNGGFGQYNSAPPSSETAVGTLVVRDAAQVTVALRTTRLNNNVLFAVVRPGATVNVTMDYQVWNQAGCVGCVTQVVIGINNTAQQCAFNDAPGLSPGRSGNAAFTLTAPAAVGVYDVRYKATQEFSCANGITNYNGAPPTTNFAIATLVVVP